MPRRNHVPTVFDKAADLIVKQLMEEGKPTVPQGCSRGNVQGPL